MKTCVIYSTATGNTETVAKLISNNFENCVLEDVANSDLNNLEEFDLIILGTSTAGFGEVQYDWDEKLNNLAGVKGKNVALFALGDQIGYQDSFAGGISEIYEKVKEFGGNIIGSTSTQGYDFKDSEAVKDGNFVGLIIDEENQANLTQTRIDNWIKKLIQ
ncbi:MAG: flavodoxin [Spirochaetales bacterium]|nr:flavodoxin [Spirochaetales bacterium]